MTLRLHNLKPRVGSKHRVKRLGSGESSGHGKTSGRGGKGQTARSGGTVRLGFEGGQMPLIRRIPKRGFNNAAFRDEFSIVNLEALQARFDDGATVTPEILVERGVLKRILAGVKVLGNGEISKKLTVKAHAFSASAREKIEKAGGSCEILTRFTPKKDQKSAKPAAPKQEKS
jgi:large subunit ribosomal protein L15